MSGIFEQLLKKLKKSENDLLIRSSGSTRDGGNEKIRSGQSYLYKMRGMESEVIEVRFVDNVRGSALSQALREALKRYPYFQTKLLEKDGDFYIVQNDVEPVVRKTEKLARLGSIECGHHLIDIIYYAKSAFISFHHALCDGRGIKPFVETLIWYYCNFRYGQTEKVEGVRLAGEPLLPGETLDPFMHLYECNETKQFPAFTREAFALPESTQKTDGDYRYEMIIPHDAFMRVCKDNNATPAILLSIAMSGAIAKIFPDYDKPINANIATDMRAALDCENTFKNCVYSMILPYDREFAQMSLKEQATQYRQMLALQRDADFCKHEANAMLGLFDKLDQLPSFEEKQSIMSFFESMLLNTYIVSYLGQFVLGGNARYVDEIHLYNAGTAGLGINMISCGEKFVLDFKQSFASDQYGKAFAAQLNTLKIPCKISDVIAFSTPTDKLVKRNA